MKNNQHFPKEILWGQGKENHHEIPKIIWIYWDSIAPSPLVDFCLKQVQRLLPDFEIHILNKNTLRDFLPNIIPMRDDLPLANYSDVIRLNLLKAYGGIWMDASILLTENLDWVFKIKQELKTDVIGFYADTFTNNINLPILETWFLAAPKNNEFISNWSDEFDQCYASKEPHLYFENELKATQFQQKFDERATKYLIAYLAAMKIMKNNRDYRIFMSAASKTAHQYNFGNKSLRLDENYYKHFLIKKTPLSYPKLIKFEKVGRNLITEQIINHNYKEKSFLFSILNGEKSTENMFIRLLKKLLP